MNEFFWPVRVYYEDTDAGGVVYYANYMKFIERARTEMLRSSGFEQDQLKREQGLVFAVHSIEAKYHKPARFNDELNVRSTITKMASASLVFKQSIYRKEDNLLLFDARVRIACIDVEAFSTVSMPDDIKRTIAEAWL